jgi:hypothetical protein
VRAGLYRLRDAHRSVRLAVSLFLVVLGCAYVFAFLMVRTWAGLSPSQVAAVYAPSGPIDAASLPETGSRQTETLDLSAMGDMTHTVDVNLLVQDSHVHLLLYAIVAALESLIVLGLVWPAWWRDAVISAAFLSGLSDFAGQWLMKAGLPAFAWLTLASGWTMAAVYLVICTGVIRELIAARRQASPLRT